jgi:threonine dehydrogenase-like Zn-dependent dehydrogenase
MIMGHEFSGEIVELGNGVSSLSKGCRVVVQPLMFCGECEFCKKGLHSLCVNFRMLGVMNINGAMAEYVCVPEKQLLPMPSHISFLEAAFTEPLAVAYSASLKTDVIGKTVTVVGAGTIGILLVSVLKQAGAKKIIAVDVSEFRLNMAKKLGADLALNPSKVDAAACIKNDFGGADISFEAVGASPTARLSLECLRKRVKAVWIGNNVRDIQINMQQVVTQELQIQGTFDYTQQIFSEAAKLIYDGKVPVKDILSSTITLDQAPDVFKNATKNAEKMLKAMIVLA